MARNSLLDPLPVRGRMGTTRDVLGHDSDEDPTSPRSLLRHYNRAMMERHGRVPTLGEMVGAAFESRTCYDDTKQRAILDSLQRTMVGYQGTAGGFLIPYGVADSAIDRAREVDGPWRRCVFWPVPTRQYFFPTFYETSVAEGSRFGGISSQQGKGEISAMTATDGKLALIETNQERLTTFFVESRDLFADTRILDVLSYAAIADMRAKVEDFMINGPNLGPSVATGPSGCITSPCTVTITRATTGQLKAIDIDKLAAAISPGCWQSPSVAFYANKQTIEVIDQLAVSGQYPEAMYMRAGTSVWTPHPTLKGKPLIQTNFCPNVGTAGDLIAADFGQYLFTYLKPNPTDSPLSFAVGPATDDFHKGVLGMPIDAIEGRQSLDRYFDQDEVAVLFKMRCDGRWLWTSTSTDAQGNVIGPVAVISN